MKEDFDPIWVAPNVTAELAEFIQSARLIMYSMQDGDVIKHAITSGQTLAQGASAFIAQTINLVESKLGELSPEDQNVVAVHLAGTLVDYANKEGDPEAKNKKVAVESITDAVMQVLQQGEQQEPQAEESQEAPGQPEPMQMQQGPPQAAPQGPPQPRPLLSSMNGQ